MGKSPSGAFLLPLVQPRLIVRRTPEPPPTVGPQCRTPALRGRTRLIPGSFEYHRPSNLSEAIALLGSLDSEARLIAGGHSLIPDDEASARAAQPSDRPRRGGRTPGRRPDGGDIVIGAMTTQHDMIASDAARRAASRSFARQRRRSPTPRCAIWARSAATPPTAIRATTCRR